MLAILASPLKPREAYGHGYLTVERIGPGGFYFYELLSRTKALQSAVGASSRTMTYRHMRDLLQLMDEYRYDQYMMFRDTDMKYQEPAFPVDRGAFVCTNTLIESKLTQYTNS